MYTATQTIEEVVIMTTCTQQATRRRDTVARPRTGEMPIQHVRALDDDWADLDTASDSKRAEVVRELIRWYLRRPGSHLPTRPAAADWLTLRKQEAMTWFASFGHVAALDDEKVIEKDGRREWQCQRCDSVLSLSTKGKKESSTGKAACTGTNGDE
ncbi:hypothetical protein [Streptantibioticus silvisoli]|uniref:Uncharacterized protein n=1 Tax=Streptantibioticus silvisoli TaxID=2705255 RepID=A0ABT6W254_9ACTN|nr:hypothetical protein [Streptantibioticus silvisoli]MDI5964828.1 hypothetical protein [Streptantibioticus silvisoli]